MGLQVNMLGGFEIRLDGGEPIEFPTRKSAALLAILALEPGLAHTREEIAALLWPNSGEAQARGSLRQTLTRTRRLIAAPDVPGIETKGENLFLNPANVEVDTAAFNRALAEGTIEALKKAAPLYGGEFLHGFSLAEQSFEDWMAAERRRLHDRAVEALAKLLRHHADEGNTGEGIELGQHLLTLDPALESAHRNLMRLYAAQGARDAVVRQYERCREALERDLGIEPSAETRALYREFTKTPAGRGDGEAGRQASIAVLAFDNISGDAEQEYFSDGISEDIITDLSKLSNLFVIAHNSSFKFKGRSVDVRDVGNDLGVRYVLEGSVRKAAGRVRITAQLVEADTGSHLWAERYDRDYEDIFALQDEITGKIVTALIGKLTDGEQQRLVSRYTDDPLAYDFFLKGRAYFLRWSQYGHSQARKMYEQAIELDPDFAGAYAEMSHTFFMESIEWDGGPEALDRGLELAQKAVALDDSLPLAHVRLGWIYLWKRRFEQAIAEYERAITLDPNHADAYSRLAQTLCSAGKPEEGIDLAKKAMRLDPYYPASSALYLGNCYYWSGRYEEALEAFKNALARYPDFGPALRKTAAIYAELGRMDEARADIAELLRVMPEASLEHLRRRPINPERDPAAVQRYHEALRKAGLPEGVPGEEPMKM